MPHDPIDPHNLPSDIQDNIHQNDPLDDPSISPNVRDEELEEGEKVEDVDEMGEEVVGDLFEDDEEGPRELDITEVPISTPIEKPEEENAE